MEVVVKNKNVGISPFKVRKVCDLIRGKKASDAARLLRFNEKEIALVLSKLLNSGLTIATSDKNMDLDNLVVSSISVDEGLL